MLLGEELGVTGVPIDNTWLPKSPEVAAEYDRLEQEREDLLGPVHALEEQLEQQRLQEIAAYGQALKEHLETAARALPGLAVPVLVDVDVDLTWSPRPDRPTDLPDIVERLVEQAIASVPSPKICPARRSSACWTDSRDRGPRRSENAASLAPAPVSCV